MLTRPRILDWEKQADTPRSRRSGATASSCLSGTDRSTSWTEQLTLDETDVVSSSGSFRSSAGDVGLLDQVLRALSPEPWAEHERRAGAWIRDLDDAGAFHRRHTSPEDRRPRWRKLAKRRSTEITARFKQTEPSVVGSALLLMIRRAKDGVTPAAYFWRQPQSHLDFAWEVTRSDALLAGSVAAGLRREWFEMAWAVDWVVTMLERTGGAASTPADDLVVDGLLQWVDGLGVGRAPTDWRVALRRRIAGLRRAPDADLDLSGLYDVDSWSSSVVAELRRSDDPEQTSSLVRLVVDAKGSKPGPQWLTRAREVLAASTARDGLRHMLTALVDAPVARGGSGWSAVPCVVAPDNADVARATTWAASQVEEAWVVPTLHAVADRGLGAASRRVVDPNVDPFSGDKIFNGAILALGLVGTPEAVAALQRLSLATRHNGIRTRLHAALGSAAERSGLTRGQHVERMVPTEDFGPDGIRAVGAEPGTARLVLEHGGAVAARVAEPRRLVGEGAV